MCDFCEIYRKKTKNEKDLKSMEWLFPKSHDDLAIVTTPYGIFTFSGFRYCPICGKKIERTNL